MVLPRSRGDEVAILACEDAVVAKIGRHQVLPNLRASVVQLLAALQAQGQRESSDGWLSTVDCRLSPSQVGRR